MLNSIIFFVAGLAALLVGAELFVKGSSSLAGQLGVSSLVIGLTVVSIGTSAPELAVSISSGYAGEPDIMVGNVVGSNICNILFILGLAAIVAPLFVNHRLVRQDVPLLIGVSILLWLLSLDGTLGFGESAAMLMLLIAYIAYTVWQGHKSADEVSAAEDKPGHTPRRHWSFHLLLIAAGLALLVFGAEWMIDSAVEIAVTLGISSAIIGLTVIAFGTSLPEAATSIIAGLRGERDIAVGNLVGSNLFNILGILGIGGLIVPGDIGIAPGILAFDMPVMVAVAVACLPIFFTGYRIARWEGFVFVAYYLFYFFYLFLYSQQHDLLPLYNSVMLWFVLPLTAVTFIVIAYREYRVKKYG